MAQHLPKKEALRSKTKTINEKIDPEDPDLNNPQYEFLKPKAIKKHIQPHLEAHSARANSPMRYTFGLRSPTEQKKSVFEDNDKARAKNKKQSTNDKNLSSKHNKDKGAHHNYNYNLMPSSRVNENGVLEITPQPIFINRKKKSENEDKPQVVNLQFEINVSRDPLPGTSGDVNEPSVIVSPRKKIKSKERYTDNFSSSSSSPEIIKEEITAYIPPQSPKQEINNDKKNNNSSNYDSTIYNSHNSNNSNYIKRNIINNNNIINNDADSTTRKVKLVKKKKRVLKQKNNEDKQNISERSINQIDIEPQSYFNTTTQTISNVATQTTEEDPTLLKISVIEAEVKGTSEGQSYACFVQLNDEEKETNFNRSRKPQWKKNMSFMVPNIFSDELLIKVVEKTEDDQYVISSLTIPLKKVALDDEINQWFDMESDISKRDGGRIRLKMSAASINYAPNHK